MGALYESYKMVESSQGQVVQTISSREVAEMMEIQHKNLIAKIDNINKTFGNRIDHKKYWVKSSYKDSTGRTLKEYQVTKKDVSF